MLCAGVAEHYILAIVGLLAFVARLIVQRAAFSVISKEGQSATS